MEEILGVLFWIIVAIWAFFEYLFIPLIEFIAEYWVWLLIIYFVGSFVWFAEYFFDELEKYIKKYKIENNKKLKDIAIMNIVKNAHDNFSIYFDTWYFQFLIALEVLVLKIILLILFLIHYIIRIIIFAIVKTIDTMYTNNRKIICNSCYGKYNYPPIFRCKNCGVLHKDLKPDIEFGILNHTCKCGNKLPVFLGNRNKLEAICKNDNCKHKIPKEILKFSNQIAIPIIGVDNKDKNKFIYTFFKTLKSKYIFESDEIKYNNFQNNNSITFPHLLNVKIKNKLVYLFNPNEDKHYNDIDNMLKEKFYNYAHGYIVIINIKSFKSIQKKYNIKYDKSNAFELLSRFIEVLEHKKELKYNKKYEKPILFVFINDGLNGEQIDINKLEEFGENNFVKLIETNFSNYKFLTLGKDKNLEKLFWFWKQANKKFTKKHLVYLIIILSLVFGGFYFRDNIANYYNVFKDKLSKNIAIITDDGTKKYMKVIKYGGDR